MPDIRTTSPRRACRSLSILLLVSVLAAGSLSNAIASVSGPVTGARVALSGVVLVVAMTLAGRVMIVLDRARRRARTVAERPPKVPSTARANRRR